MSYYMDQVDQQFTMKESDRALAFAALKQWEQREIERQPSLAQLDWSPLGDAETLEDALEELEWKAENNEAGDIIGLYFTGEKLHDEEEWLNYIAPYVTLGSYLTMRGEDGSFWRWYFNSKTCTEYDGEVVFPDIPENENRVEKKEPDESDKASSYSFMIREIQTMIVGIEADSYDEARDLIENKYDDDEFNLDRNCFAGVEFRPCCSCCESDFDSDNELIAIDGRLLCERCVRRMKEAGELAWERKKGV